MNRNWELMQDLVMWCAVLQHQKLLYVLITHCWFSAITRSTEQLAKLHSFYV